MKNTAHSGGRAVFAIAALLAAMCITAGCDLNEKEEVKKFTVSYAAGEEGSGQPPQSQQVLSGALIYLPPYGGLTAPAGKSFAGWETGNEPYSAGDSFTVTQDTVFNARWESGSSENNGEVTDVNSPLAKPASVTAVIWSSSEVKISWGAVSGAARYKVYCSKVKDSDYYSITNDAITGTEYVDGRSSIAVGDTLYYKVSAVRSSDSEGVSSEAVSVVFGKPDQPSNFNVTAQQQQNSFAVSWNALPGVLRYRIYYAVDPNGTWNEEDSTGNSWTTSGWSKGTTVYFKMAGVNGLGAGEKTAQKSGTLNLTLPPPSDSLSSKRFTKTDDYAEGNLTLKHRIDWYKINWEGTDGAITIIGFDRDQTPDFFYTGDIIVSHYNANGNMVGSAVNIGKGSAGTTLTISVNNGDTYYLKVEINPLTVNGDGTGTYRINVTQ